MKTPYSLVASAYLVLAVAWVAPAADSTPAASTSAASKPTPAERPSLWGQAVSGVQARLFMPTEVEQDALVPIRLEIANDPDRLPAGVGRFDTFLLQTRVVVSMTNVKTKQSLTVRPPVPVNGIPTRDTGGEFVRLDGTAVKPFEMDVALRSAGASLEPGDYDCVLSCPVDEYRPKWLLQAEPPGSDWWSGKFQTAPLRVKVVPATAKHRTLFLPKVAYLAKSQLNAGFELRCDKKDVEAAEVPIRNGCYLGTRISRAGGASELTGDAISLPEGGSLFDDPTDPSIKVKPGDRLTFTLEVFETERAAEHLWLPVPGQDGYKTLWTRSFKVRVPESPQR